MTREFELLWLKGLKAQARASALSSHKPGHPRYQERVRKLVEVDEVIFEILNNDDHLKMVALKIEARKGGRWQVLHLVYDTTSLKTPLPNLGEDLTIKVRKIMNANTKTSFVSDSHLFDGLSLAEAIAVYKHLNDEAKKLEGQKVPNHHADTVNREREGSFHHRNAVERREKIREQDGYILEGIPFLGFWIERSFNSGQYLLTREPLFRLYSTQPRETLATANVDKPKDLAEVAERLLFSLVVTELADLAKEALKDERFTVFVKDVNKIGGYTETVIGWAAAIDQKNDFAHTIDIHERGNSIIRATLKCQWGTFVYQPYGRMYFDPNEAMAAKLSQEELTQLVTRHQHEVEEMRRLWTAIVAAYAVSPYQRPEENFSWEGMDYSVNRNPNSSHPSATGIRCAQWPNPFAGSMDFLPHLRSGLLKAWADFVSPEALEIRRAERQRKLEEAQVFVRKIQEAMKNVPLDEYEQKAPRWNGSRVIFDNNSASAHYGSNGFISLVDLLDRGILQKWLDNIQSN